MLPWRWLKVVWIRRLSLNSNLEFFRQSLCFSEVLEGDNECLYSPQTGRSDRRATHGMLEQAMT